MFSCVFAWMPVIDSQRVQLDATAPIPYWLGISCPPGEIIDVQALQGGQVLFDLQGFTGTSFKLAYIDSYFPVYFYEDNLYSGRIVPEPGTLGLILTGTLILRRKK